MPFMYNLEQMVEGLDVVDFPGVDDRDETIPELAELLLFLAQVVIFVVDYRLTLKIKKIGTSSVLYCSYTLHVIKKDFLGIVVNGDS